MLAVLRKLPMLVRILQPIEAFVRSPCALSAAAASAPYDGATPSASATCCSCTQLGSALLGAVYIRSTAAKAYAKAEAHCHNPAHSSHANRTHSSCLVDR